MESADKFFKVARLKDLRQGEAKGVHAGLKKLALVLYDGEVYCVQSFCPHAGGSLAHGAVKGKVVKCPGHNWGFDVTTGECLTNARYDVRRYVTRVDEEGWVHVGVPEDGTII